MILLAAALAYHIDLTRIFATPEAEKADRAVLEREIGRLEKFRGRVPEHLGETLDLNDTIQTRLARHDMYLYLRHAMDTENPDESPALDAGVASKTAFLNDEILRMKHPTLASRQFQIDSIRRWREHTLSEDGEKALASTKPLALNWQYDLYQTSQDREVVAFALMRLASSRTAYARMRHFHDAASWTYFRSYWTRAEVDSMLERVEKHADLYKRYEKIRADHPQSIAAPQFTIDDARRILLDATAPLGPEYARELSALLDPANGRMDILPGPHRKSGGFSQGTIGVDSVFFSGGFTGKYNDVRVLAHESTHAMQRQLMNAAHVPMAYSSGPGFLAEAMAIFNELVLADYMAAHATDAAMRRFFLEQFLNGKGLIAFVAAPEAELEEAVYDGVDAGTIRNAEDLDHLTETIYAKYTLSPVAQRWTRVTLMYEDPFYDINYVFGSIVALRMYAMFARDPAGFAPKYMAMMRNGYDAPPNVLLAEFFGFDLNDPRLLDPVIDLLNERIESLRTSY